MYSFGSGVLIGTRTDVTNATPINFGLIQEVTIEESASVKEIYGQYQRPLAEARGTIKTTARRRSRASLASPSATSSMASRPSPASSRPPSPRRGR